jgi:hypothetical protein|tara:strand:+ start:164 stop:313 length:150 start_codon:yes stop_codon:yes gene_type:complete
VSGAAARDLAARVAAVSTTGVVEFCASSEIGAATTAEMKWLAGALFLFR